MDADEMQSFIDGVQEKMETQVLTRQDAMALALGRCCTIMMDHCAELARFAGENEVQTVNAGVLATVYFGLVDTFREDIQRIMNEDRRVLPC